MPMVLEDYVRKIRFSDYKEIKDDNANRKWLQYPRKKICENNINKLLKVDGKKAVYQYCVSRLKPLFKIEPVETELIYDIENKNFGTLTNWIANIGI